MSAIEIRSEFVRIARLFTSGVTRSYHSDHAALKNIYVEPHASGKGVQIVSCDGAAMCVQWDREGTVERPYLICGVDKDHAKHMSGNTINERWLIGNPNSGMTVVGDTSLNSSLKKYRVEGAGLCRVRVAGDETDEPGVTIYPNWRVAVPTQDEIVGMVDGFPGTMSVEYLSIIARLYEDGMQHERGVRVMSNGSPTSNVLVQFPWRDGTFVVIAPLDRGMEGKRWDAMLSDVISTTPVADSSGDEL
jgi:hypothetical protein